MEDIELSLKVIIVGNGRVGKTSMMNRFARGVTTDKYKKTIGTDFCEKDLTLPSGVEAKLMIWDTAGQEVFNSLTSSYYRGAEAVVFVFSTVDRDSFEAVESWRETVAKECPDISAVLVQNKTDLLDEAVVEPAEAEALSAKLGLPLYRTSVKMDHNVEKLFIDLTEKVVQRRQEHKEAEEVAPTTAATTASNTSSSSPQATTIKLDNKRPQKKKGGPC